VTLKLTVNPQSSSGSDDWWKAAPLAAPAADNSLEISSQAKVSGTGDDWWKAAPLAAPAPTPEQPQPNPAQAEVPNTGMGYGKAALSGLSSGFTANFADELGGVAAASGLPMVGGPMGALAPVVGGARLLYENTIGSPGEATEKYQRTRDAIRATQKAAAQEYPGTYLAGEIGGAIANPASRLAGGATRLAQAGRGALAGGVYGGIAGAGEGEDFTDRTGRALTGAAVGGTIGAAAPPLVEVIGRVARAAVRPVVNTVRGLVSPEAEAARRVGGHVAADIRADPDAVSRLTAPEFQAYSQAGGPATVMDLGGEATRALARSAANTSPEGRGILNRTINERFEGQEPRVTGWLRETFNYPDAAAQQKAIEQTARTVNAGAYAKAFSDGARPLWDEGFEQLTAAPAVQEAIKRATKTGANKAAAEGFRPPQSPFQFAADGTMTPKQGVHPTLQFWDSVKRNLDDMINSAKRSGEKEAARDLNALRTSMVSHLDELVPSYQKARSGAAHFFGAENALEAGQNFVTQNLKNDQVRHQLAKMSATERQLFQDGFVSRYIETLERVGDRRSVLNKIAESPQAREKLEMVLGPQKARELEAAKRVEGIMDLARGAVQGNSKTAQYLTELGLAGGVGGYGYFTSDPKAIMYAGLVWGAARGRNVIDSRVATKVAQMLTSSDPAVASKGIQMVARSERLLDQFRRVDKHLARTGAVSTPSANPAIQLPAAGRADEQQGVPRPIGQ
jgi:hypothetical protein